GDLVRHDPAGVLQRRADHRARLQLAWAREADVRGCREQGLSAGASWRGDLERAADLLVPAPRHRLRVGRPSDQGALMATDAVTTTAARVRPAEVRNVSAGLWSDALWRLRHDPTTVAALVVLGTMVALALAADLLAVNFYHRAFSDQDILSNYSKPSGAEPWLWLGTDELGRSQTVRLLYGARVCGRGPHCRMHGGAADGEAHRAQHHPAHYRPGHDGGGNPHPGRVGDLVHWLRPPAPDAVVGQHAYQCRPVSRQGAVSHLP